MYVPGRYVFLLPAFSLLLMEELEVRGSRLDVECIHTMTSNINVRIYHVFTLRTYQIDHLQIYHDLDPSEQIDV